MALQATTLDMHAIIIALLAASRSLNQLNDRASCCRGRKDNLEKARALWSSGNTGAAHECYQKAVDISPTTAKRFIEVSSPDSFV